MNKETTIEETDGFYGTIILPSQDPEVIISAIDFPIPTFNEETVEYDIETGDLILKNVLAYLSYSSYLHRYARNEFNKIAGSPLTVIYGEKTKVKSTVPFFWSNEEGKNPRVKLGEEEKNIYVVSNRGRDKNRMNLIDTLIFPETLNDPLEMDDLVNKAYRSSARIKYGDYIRAFQIPYHLGAFPEILPNVRFIRDLYYQRVKYKLNSWGDYKAFGPEGWSSDFSSLPIRAVQWYDSPDDYGIWIKPGNLYGPTQLPPGKPILLNGKYSKIDDLSFYLFSNNYGILFSESDPRFVFLKTDLAPWKISSKYGQPYGLSDQILFNENGWKKPKTQRKGTPTLPIYSLDEFVRESCPEYINVVFSDMVESPLRNWTEWLLDDYCYIDKYDPSIHGEGGKESIDRMRYMAKLIL